MHKRQKQTFAGIGALGAAALLLGGCGGNSFSKGTFANYPNTLPYVSGIEPIIFYGQLSPTGSTAIVEASGLQAATGGQAYITGASAFTAVTANGATLALNADPNGTKSLPLGFSTGGLYVDAVNQTGAAPASVTSVAPGTSVVFRAAIANGTTSSNTTAEITGATLTSTDPALASVAGLTAGLPMSLNVVGGAFSNATYATGTGGTATPFTIPAGLPSGLHTAVVTVSDNAGRVTATTFMFPIVASTDVALFLQSFTVAVPMMGTTPATTKQVPITAGDTVTIDGGPGTGTYPTGFASTTADAQGTVILFTTPGTHTVTETNAKGTVQTATFTIPTTDASGKPVAGTTLFNAPLTTANSGGGGGGAIRGQALRRH